MNTLNFRIALSMLSSLRPSKARELLSFVDGNIEDALNPNIVSKLPNVLPSLIEELESGACLRRAEAELDFVERHNIKVCWYEDSDYPQRLFYSSEAPLLLYQKGQANLNASKVVSVVGTRHMTAYGKQQTEKLIADMAAAFPDILIVSGLAYGIDISAHRAALKQHLPTVGVVAHGLDRIYPNIHRQTAIEMIAQEGGLITEQPTGTAPLPARFVQRNRIIAGLCDACIVMESAEKGGSMITARMARDENREVFALPGRSSDTYSRGCHELIKRQVASLIDSVEDLFREMNWELPKNQVEPSLFPSLSPELAEILKQMQAGEIYSLEALQELQKKKSSIGELMSLMLQLEMEGAVESLPGGRYCRSSL